MPPRPEPLNALRVKNAKPGRYGDGRKLYLLVRGPEAAWWTFRYVRNGRMRELGLGPARGAAAVPLTSARKKAAALDDMVRAGLDPLNERVAEEAAAKAEAQAAVIAARSFRQAAEDCQSALNSFHQTASKSFHFVSLLLAVFGAV